ncbi:MAG: DUF1934 domain-containing protein [Eubacterium sp.]|nr:DUF1934 domain-containing protein [Eubacterium sp.]
MINGLKKINVKITGSSELGETVTEAKGTLTEDEGSVVITYYEKFEGDSVATKSILTIKGGEVYLEKSGGVKAAMVFSHGKSHEVLYDTGAGRIPMKMTTDKVFTKLHEDGADVELEYTISFGPGNEAKNSLKLVARYM